MTATMCVVWNTVDSSKMVSLTLPKRPLFWTVYVSESIRYDSFR